MPLNILVAKENQCIRYIRIRSRFFLECWFTGFLDVGHSNIHYIGSVLELVTGFIQFTFSHSVVIEMEWYTAPMTKGETWARSVEELWCYVLARTMVPCNLNKVPILSGVTCLIIPPHNEVVVGVYWFHSVRPSVRPSRIPCPLCSFYSSGWIHFIFYTSYKGTS